MPTNQQARHQAALERASNKAGAASFKHPGDAMDLTGEEKGDLVTRLTEVLTPVMLFISKGRLTNTMELRSWVFLYETRIDLIRGETIDQFAKRIGVSAPRVQALINEFRALVPAYRSSNRKSVRAVTKMCASATARHPLPHPPERKPLFPSESQTGSALH